MSTTIRSYQIGDKIRLSAEAIENYGEQYTDTILTVSQWFDHYSDIGGCDEHGHPGFDSGAGSALYEFEDFPNALYQWEMILVEEA